MALNWSLFFRTFFAMEWVLRVIMLFIVPKNKRPSSATAWLMLIMLEPTLGSLAFWVFGNPKLPRYRQTLKRYADSHITKELEELDLASVDGSTSDSQLSEQNEQFIKLNHALGGLPVFGGSDIRLIDDYNKSLQALEKDINNAKHRILFEYFILVMDETSEPILLALENATARGVEIYVLFDALACRSYPNFRLLKQRLTLAGIVWKPMLPLSLKPGKKFTRPDLRNHRKIVVIDGKIGYTGSQNIITKNYHRRDDLYYEELVVRVVGPIVWQLAALFRTDWYSETKVFLPADKLTTSSGNTLAQILPSGPSHGGSNNLKLYTALIHSAKYKIVITTPYFVPDDALMTALTSAAERGVEVTLINSQIVDKLLVGHAQRSYYEELLRAGVRVFLYKKPVFLHTKHITVDTDVAVVGSSNLDIRSFELDLEVSLIIYDKKLVEELREIEKRYIEGSVRLNINKWLNRRIVLKSIESIARLTASLQ